MNGTYSLSHAVHLLITEKQQGIHGPLFLDSQARRCPEPANASALEALAANGVQVMIAQNGGYIPMPLCPRLISHV